MKGHFHNSILGPRSLDLLKRAADVIPGAIPGHQSPALAVPGQFPYFAERAEGALYWDTDGNRYIDFMCGYGPLVLGAAHPEVDQAFTAAQSKGVCFNHPTEQTVKLAERLVQLVDVADWAFFGKNGADMTFWALRVAREFSGRRKIIKVKGAYHGTEPWCTDCLAGVLAEDKAHIIETPWNDCQTLEEQVQKHAADLAAIVTTPFDHPTFGPMTMPDPAFLATIQRLIAPLPALWILDDIRAGFRHHIGGSHRHFNFTPDLICFSKAVANGYSLSATVGTEQLKAAASRTFATGSFWNNPGPMAAALKTMEVLERDDCIPAMLRRGAEWTELFLELGEKRGIPLIASGTPTLPFIHIANDPGFHQQQKFCSAAIRQGVFLHPHHNWFISNAHSDSILEESLTRIDKAMQQLHQ